MAQRDARPPFAAIDGAVPPEFSALPTPCYLLDEAALTRNAEILGGLARRTGCKVLLAQKAFSNYDLYPLLAPHLAGTEASGLFEARPRTATRFTTPAPPAAVWARPAPSGTRQRQKILPCPGCWTACTFTLYVSRTPMRWP